MGIEKTYTDELFAQNRYYASWFPNEQIKLGDIGDIEGRWFHRIDNIDALTVPEARKHFGSRRAPTKTQFSYCSEGVVQQSGDLAGSAPVANAIARASGKVKINFVRQHAVWFAATDCAIEEVEHQLALREQIKFLLKLKVLTRPMAVVTQVVHAARCTVLVSGSAGESVDLAVDAKGGVAGVSLLEASASARRVAGNATGVCLVGERDTTPLFQAMRLNLQWLEWLGQPEFVAHNELGGSVSFHPGEEPDVLVPIA